MSLLVETVLVGAVFWIREHNAERRLSEELARRRRQGTWTAAPPQAVVGDDHKHRFVRVLLEWKGVECRLATTDKTSKEKRIRKILTKMRGKAEPGRLTCILGPSGSGKTTLLNTLAQQVPRCDNMQLIGRVNINGRPAGMSRHLLSYVRQEDMFYSQLTVRETLRLAAALRLPKTISRKKKEAYVEELLNKLGLTKSADTIVGDEKVRGISGGERKRLNIGCELVSGPSLVLADEPTTGLDSFQAERVMATMRRLAHDGHTVICTVHQPSSSIFRMIDDLLLLSEGEVVYHGPAKEAVAYFEGAGHACPEQTNPAEFFADLISIDYSSDESLHESRARVRRLTDAWARRTAAAHARDEKEAAAESDGTDDDAGGLGWALAARAAKEEGSRPDWWEQFQLLLTRSWRQATRDKAATIVRTVISVVSAGIFGSIYFQLGVSQASIQSRLGLFQMAAVSTAMSALSKTLNLFVRERGIVQADRAKGAYGVAAYFFSKLVAELPTAAVAPLTFASLLYPMAGLHASPARFLKFLAIHALESFTSSAVSMTIGALAPSQDAALAMGPPVYLIFILFGGYTVSSQTVPWIFRWVPNVSLMRWGFEAMCVNDLRGLEFDCRRPGDTCDGDEVLERLGYGESSLAGALLANVRIMLLCYAATYSILSHRTPTFQAMLRRDPNPELAGPRLEEVSEEEAERIVEAARAGAALRDAEAAARAADEEIARLSAEREALAREAERAEAERAAREAVAVKAAEEREAAAAQGRAGAASEVARLEALARSASLEAKKARGEAELAHKLSMRRQWEAKPGEGEGAGGKAPESDDRRRAAEAERRVRENAARSASSSALELEKAEGEALAKAGAAREALEAEAGRAREEKERAIAAAAERAMAQPAPGPAAAAGEPLSAAKAMLARQGGGASPAGVSHSISSDSLIEALSAPIPADPSPGASPYPSPAPSPASSARRLNPAAAPFRPGPKPAAPILDSPPATAADGRESPSQP
eukprot:tig00000789_g4105.t1